MPEHKKQPLPKGFLLRGYRIERTLGGGGFSLVYLATDLESREKVAIKEFLPGAQAQRLANGRVEPSVDCARFFHHGIKRFFEEGSALARVHHPNIVHVTNFFRANNTVYMVMRYEEGRDLRWYIKRHRVRGLSEKFLRTVFPALLNGLAELHRNDLLHLDIKPANIFLRAGGNPLLLDFGAAQRACVGTRLNGPNTLTFGFAPLEQHEKREVGPWTDLYALGASMYACITGSAPPPAPDRETKDRYRPLARGTHRQYSRVLLEAVDWCLERDPAARPQSVDELLAAFSHRPSTTENLSGLLRPWEYLNERLGVLWGRSKIKS